MFLEVEAHSLAGQAQRAAARAAVAAGVATVDEADTGRLRDVAALLVSVWGTAQNASPIPAELLRSIIHAGCNVTAAYDADGFLCGTAVAIVSPGNTSMYSLIAGVLPRAADRGVGFALKQHQRAWALARGITSMVWTFDPLVSRNARFNLTKLGAQVSDYEQNFYGFMDDEINADDESDRLVAVWPLDAARSIDCSEGRFSPLAEPEFTDAMVRDVGPDGDPVVVEAQGATWVRVPRDIVKLRAEDPAEARAWRLSTRTVLRAAFAAGCKATGTTRTGWYRLTTGRNP